MPTRILVAVFALGAAPALAGDPELFTASATFVPASASAPPLVRVLLTTTDADVQVKGRPAPRLWLSSAQRPLVPLAPRVDAQAEPGSPYVDLGQPLRFRVELTDDGPAEGRAVEARLSFVYCSTTKGWCRKGSTKLEIPVGTR